MVTLEDKYSEVEVEYIDGYTQKGQLVEICDGVVLLDTVSCGVVDVVIPLHRISRIEVII